MRTQAEYIASKAAPAAFDGVRGMYVWQNRKGTDPYRAEEWFEGRKS